jgi:hypothetical protein
MAKGEEVNRAKLVKMLEVARDLHEKMAAVLEECDELLGGGAGLAAQIKAFERAFDEAWGRRYAAGQHGRYVWRYAADVPNIKRLLKQFKPNGLEELTKRANRYLSTEDDFLKRNRHPFGLFVSGVNSYADEGQAVEDLELDPAAPSDCKHTPRCRTEVEHTKRRSADLRA